MQKLDMEEMQKVSGGSLKVTWAKIPIGGGNYILDKVTINGPFGKQKLIPS